MYRLIMGKLLGTYLVDTVYDYAVRRHTHVSQCAWFLNCS